MFKILWRLISFNSVGFVYVKWLTCLFLNAANQASWASPVTEVPKQAIHQICFFLAFCRFSLQRTPLSQSWEMSWHGLLTDANRLHFIEQRHKEYGLFWLKTQNPWLPGLRGRPVASAHLCVFCCSPVYSWGLHLLNFNGHLVSPLIQESTKTSQKWHHGCMHAHTHVHTRTHAHTHTHTHTGRKSEWLENLRSLPFTYFTQHLIAMLITAHFLNAQWCNHFENNMKFNGMCPLLMNSTHLDHMINPSHSLSPTPAARPSVVLSLFLWSPSFSRWPCLRHCLGAACTKLFLLQLFRSRAERAYEACHELLCEQLT